MALKLVISVDDKGTARVEKLGRTIGKVKKQTISFGKIFGAVFSAQLAMKFGRAMSRSMVNLAKNIVRVNTEFEKFQVQLGVLLRSEELAQRRIQEYAEFSAVTPFQLGEIVKAGKVLQIFGGDLLATGDSLKMVGDMAAATGKDFESVGLHVGRMYSALQAGRPWGRAALALQRMGILSGTVRSKLEAMQKSGISGQVVWEEFTKEMGRFDGMMERLSLTVGGLTSTIRDNLTLAMVELGRSGAFAEVRNQLKSIRDWMIRMRKEGKVQEWSKIVGFAITRMARVFKASFEGIVKIMFGTAKATNVLTGSMNFALNTFTAMAKAGLIIQATFESVKLLFGSIARAINQVIMGLTWLIKVFASAFSSEALKDIENIESIMKETGKIQEESAKKAADSWKQVEIAWNDINKAMKSVVKTGEEISFEGFGGLETLEDLEEFNDKILQQQQAMQALRLELMEEGYDKELEVIGRWYEEQLRLVEGNEEAIYTLAEVYKKKRDALDEKYLNLKRQRLMNEIGYNINAGQSIVRNLETIASASKDNAQTMKEIAIAEAIINTFAAANAVLRNWSKLNPVIAFIQMATTIGAGMANVAKIQAQTFRTGGVVRGTGSATADNVQVSASPGEAFLSGEDLARVGGFDRLKEIIDMGMPGATRTIIINNPIGEKDWFRDNILPLWAAEEGRA
jgi:hypothetical protein